MMIQSNKKVAVFDASSWQVGIVRATFNEKITGQMLEVAKQKLEHFNIKPSNVHIVEVSGSVEIPLALQLLAKQAKYDCLIALGAVIKGETAHFDYVCQIVSEGVLKVMLDYSLPVGFGVLTTFDETQAIARIETAAGAVEAAIDLARIKKALNKQ